MLKRYIFESDIFHLFFGQTSLFFPVGSEDRGSRIGGNYMTYITDEKPEVTYVKKPVPQEQLQRETDYVRAQRMQFSIHATFIVKFRACSHRKNII